jgi:hypothetical protein
VSSHRWMASLPVTVHTSLPLYEIMPMPSTPFPACGGLAVHRSTSTPSIWIESCGPGTFVNTLKKNEMSDIGEYRAVRPTRGS